MREQEKVSRRAFLVRTGKSLIYISLPGIFLILSDSENLVLAGLKRPDGRPRLPPGQKAVKRIMDMGGVVGTASISDWQLRIDGEVENPVTLNFQEMLRLTQVDLVCDIHCVTGWTLLDARWRGVRLTTLMDMVRIRKRSRFVVFEAAGGYTSNIPISEAHKENVIIAHRFFDQELPRAHGAPVRALVPDRYFYKSAKWLEGIRFTFRDEPGYWERQGYSNSADPWKEQRFVE